MPANDPEVREWLRIARQDMLAARRLCEGSLYETCGFHSQQTVEKLLKAYLRWRDQSTPKIHDLTVLLDLCARIEAPFLEHRDRWEWLTGFGVVFRYPSEVPRPDSAEATRAVEAAEHCWSVLLPEMPPNLHPTPDSD
jgi:HEPN domain-containing protein